MTSPASIFYSARFFTSSASVSGLPGPGLPEIVFAGRSNAGKSTVINVITRQRQLARTSRTPGRTQLINFFELARKISYPPGRETAAWLVDLPGYGYARAAPDVRRTWSELIGGYLAGRESLTGVVIVMDARRPFMPADEWLVSFFSEKSHVRQHWLINKSDQVSRSEGERILRQARARAGTAGPHVSVQLFSGLKKTGADELRLTLAGWINPELNLAG